MHQRGMQLQSDSCPMEPMAMIYTYVQQRQGTLFRQLTPPCMNTYMSTPGNTAKLGAIHSRDVPDIRQLSGYPAHLSLSGIRLSGIRFVTQLSGIRPDIILVSGRIPDNCTFSCNKQLQELLFLGRIMMMLPLYINSYNLVNFHQNFMKLVLN